MCCPFLNDAWASMSSTVNLFLNQIKTGQSMFNESEMTSGLVKVNYDCVQLNYLKLNPKLT